MTRIENIEALTADVFSDILRENWSGGQALGDDEDDDARPEIKDISVTKVDQGVLSDVYRVHLDYLMADQDKRAKSIPPSDWLVKFCRPDLNLSWMCRNETIFYSRLAPSLMAANATKLENAEKSSSSSCSSLPFTIPKFLSGSDQHIILEEVTNIETYPLSEGCPPEKIHFLLRSLAAWHATCWESELLISQSSLVATNGQSTKASIEEEPLVFPTGMGQRLHPLQKEGLFVASWRETIDYMREREDRNSTNELDAELFDSITNLCQRLATLKLRDVHEKVHRHRVTCVHGDFHIANWLFPVTTGSTTGQEERKPVLVDFATAGYGNPLIDLVFFMVVSTNDEIVSDSQTFLEEYYRLLIEYNPNLSSQITLSTLREWFPWALLCQFMILVAYDGVCRGIAAAEKDEQKRESQLQHFCNVNRRMISAIVSIDDWDTILSELASTTPDEQQEACLFCDNNALAI